MKIIVDKEGLDKVTKLADASLKAHGTIVFALVTEVLGSMEILPDPKKIQVVEKKEIKK